MMPPNMEIPNEQIEMMKAMIGMSSEVLEGLNLNSGLNSLNEGQTLQHQQMVGMMNMPSIPQTQQFGGMNRGVGRPPVGAPTGPSNQTPPAGPARGRMGIVPGAPVGPGRPNMNGLPMRPGAAVAAAGNSPVTQRAASVVSVGATPTPGGDTSLEQENGNAGDESMRESEKKKTGIVCS